MLMLWWERKNTTRFSRIYLLCSMSLNSRRNCLKWLKEEIISKGKWICVSDLSEMVERGRVYLRGGIMEREGRNVRKRGRPRLDILSIFPSQTCSSRLERDGRRNKVIRVFLVRRSRRREEKSREFLQEINTCSKYFFPIRFIGSLAKVSISRWSDN